MAALGTALVSYGVYDLKDPDFLITHTTIEGIYQSGQMWEAAPPVMEDQRYRLRGILISCIGLGVLATAFTLASSEPDLLAPEIEPAAGTLPTYTPPETLKNTLISRIKAMLQDLPELRVLMRAPVVIVVGGQGSGKSTFCAVLAFLRALLEGDEVVILDPHYQMNVLNKYVPWVTGNIFENPEQIKAAFPSSLAPRQAGEPHRTTVCDELSNWPTTHNLADEQTLLANAGTQDARKARQRFILPVHGDAKEMICPNVDTGRYDSLMLQAVVIKLGSKTDDWGEFEPAGWMHFKPSGKPYTKNNIKQNIPLPACFLPPKDGRRSLKQEVESMLHHWGMAPQTAEQRQRLISPEIEEYTARINRHDPKIRDMLDNALKSDGATHVDASENQHNGSMEWTDTPHSKLILRLLKYCFAKRDSLIDSNGVISVRKLLRNWAQNNGLSASEFKDLLSATVLFNVGTWGDAEHKSWRPCIDPSQLPDEDDL